MTPTDELRSDLEEAAGILQHLAKHHREVEERLRTALADARSEGVGRPALTDIEVAEHVAGRVIHDVESIINTIRQADGELYEEGEEVEQ